MPIDLHEEAGTGMEKVHMLREREMPVAEVFCSVPPPKVQVLPHSCSGVWEALLQ